MPHSLVPPKTRNRAKAMRKALTEAELKLWNAARAHRLMGLGFRKQPIIAGFAVDFACPEKRIIVEVDGSQHGEPEQAVFDASRTARLGADGWIILRFWNDDVLRDIDGVCVHIVTVAGLAVTDNPMPTPFAENHP